MRRPRTRRPRYALSTRAASPFPVHLTRLVGRQREVAAVRELLGSTRLLTLTGAGGSGKTRVALEAVRQLVEAHGHAMRIAWAELAPVVDPAHLANHVAAALGVRDEGTQPIQDTIAAALGDRSLLLVLDNCEHIVNACAAFVDTLLRRCAGVRVLATSREALGIGGERAWLVPVLSLPAAAESSRRERVMESEAVQLFVQRAQDVQPSFTLSDGNAAAVAGICRRLDGLPLAIELAAARVRVLAPEQIAARLDDAFRTLGSGPRTALPRHRTLREAIGWSVRLLDAAESRLLARLSVFAGDFTLDAVERTCSDEALTDDEILETLAALVDKSLVAMREVSGGARYALLETIRQYAAETLAAAGETERWKAQHARMFADVVAALEPAFITAGRAAAVARLAEDLDNVRAALTWTRVHDPAQHLRLAAMLPWFWYSLGLWSEGRRWLEEALALPVAAAATRDRAAALFGAGAIAALQADTVYARRVLDESRDIARAIGDERLAAYASNYLGMAYAGEGLLEGVHHAEEAMAWFERHGDLYGQRLSLLLQATVHLGRGNVAEAERAAASAVDVARRFGVDRELGIALQVYGTILLHRGELDSTEALMVEALQRFRRDTQPLFMARAVDVLALVACRRGDVLTGIRLFGAAAGERELIGASLFSLDRERIAPHISAARAEAGDEGFAAAWEAGRRQRLAETIDELLAKSPAGAEHAEERRAEQNLASVAVQEAPDVALAAIPAAAAEIAEQHHDVELDVAASERAGATDGAASSLGVHAFGRLRIQRGGIEIPTDVWRSAKPRELFVYLLLHPEGRTREQIGVVFWPDASAAQVKNNFHVTLHGIRKALGGAEWIVFDDDRYRVNPARTVTVDATLFESRTRALIAGLKRETGSSVSRASMQRDRSGGAMHAAVSASGAIAEESRVASMLRALQDALDLYTGDLLADEAAGDWHLEYRDALRRLYTDALALAGDAFGQAGDHERAAEMFRRLVSIEPLDEDGYCRLMHSLARAGARTEALRQYDRLVALLETELEAAPARTTTMLRDRIARGESGELAAQRR